jgi:hypothetical protein
MMSQSVLLLAILALLPMQAVLVASGQAAQTQDPLAQTHRRHKKSGHQTRRQIGPTTFHCRCSRWRSNRKCRLPKSGRNCKSR